MSIGILFIAFLIVGYLLGSLSTAIIVCRLMGLPDPRTEGSNNPGATNVMRIGGKKAAYLTFAGDCLKGLIPVLIARFATDNDWAIAGAALGAFLGHLYPLYFGFKGGKGVATLVGIILGVSPLLLLIFGGIWAAIVFSTGYVSLASMLASLLIVGVAKMLSFSISIISLLAGLAVLVIIRHRSNIDNLLKGKEKHFKKKQK